jgi:hypothetical protein
MLSPFFCVRALRGSLCSHLRANGFYYCFCCTMYVNRSYACCFSMVFAVYEARYARISGRTVFIIVSAVLCMSIEVIHVVFLWFSQSSCLRQGFAAQDEVRYVRTLAVLKVFKWSCNCLNPFALRNEARRAECLVGCEHLIFFCILISLLLL